VAGSFSGRWPLSLAAMYAPCGASLQNIVSLGDHLRSNQSCTHKRPQTTIQSEQNCLFTHGHAGRAADDGNETIRGMFGFLFLRVQCAAPSSLCLNSTIHCDFHQRRLPSFIVYAHESPLFQSLQSGYLIFLLVHCAWCCISCLDLSDTAVTPKSSCFPRSLNL
jgi:hypothetical protein